MPPDPHRWHGLAEGVWAQCLESARNYLEKPNAPDLFRAFNPLCALVSLWRPGAAGVFSPIHGNCVSFEAAIAGGDTLVALSCAERIQAALPEPVERALLRFGLAGRALLVHGRLDIADSVISVGRAAADRGEHASIDRFLFRVRCRVQDRDNVALLQDVVKRLPQFARTAITEYLRYCLRYELATPELLRFLLTWSPEVPRDAQKALRGECLALALRLADADTAARLGDPTLLPANILERLLPLASFLEAQGIPAAWRKQRALIVEQAGLHAHIVAQSRVLMERIAEPGRSVAIVGNSPCELGKGRGREIDAHDLVIRFNLYSHDPAFAADYGSRCSIHARAIDKAKQELTARSLAVDAALFCLPNYLFVPRVWTHAQALRQKGGRLTCLPDGFHRALQHELGTAPSSGLATCALVHSIRKVLPASSCFGFSFTDQIDDPATGVRYFDRAPPSMIHRWPHERAIFERLTGTPPYAGPSHRAARQIA